MPSSFLCRNLAHQDERSNSIQKVVMVGDAAVAAASRTDEQQLAFWWAFELVLGGRLWSKVEEVLGKPTPRPTTISGWNKHFETIDLALRKSTAVV